VHQPNWLQQLVGATGATFELFLSRDFAAQKYFTKPQFKNFR
jgi:hypothetical protein